LFIRYFSKFFELIGYAVLGLFLAIFVVVVVPLFILKELISGDRNV